MSHSFSFTIRDGLASNLDACRELDHSYQTDQVWQMRIEQDHEKRSITFATERLPRTMDVYDEANIKRIQFALANNQGFIIAIGKDEPIMLGYATIISEPVYDLARVQDIVVSRPYRRRGIGSRLLNVAHQWARERNLARVVVEMQTKNYPAILFCQNHGLTFCGYNDQYFPNQNIAIFFGQSL